MASIQAASEKRELMDKKLRGKLEEELKELRQGSEMMHKISENENGNFEQVRLKLSDYEEKVKQTVGHGIFLTCLCWKG